VENAVTGGPGLIFQTLPNIFNNITGGRIWGSLFFMFMVFAAMSTVTAVFENIIAFGMDKWGWSRKKSCLINLALIIILALPCVLGYSVFTEFAPFGAGSSVLDIEDFIVSNNILPLGSLVYVLFCTLDKKAWGWNEFLAEANYGKGLKMPKKLRIYCKYILPILLVVFYVWGILSTFGVV
jgi:NSS family neurotransmitter:Na+ symporter